MPNYITDNILSGMNTALDFAQRGINGINNFVSGQTAYNYQDQMNRQIQDYNSDEALIAREFNALEAEKARNFSASEAEKARAFNSYEAELNRKFQERMSNTAYQRAFADMKSAGLNPYLAYSQGGAPVTTGSSASSSIATSQSASAYNASSNSVNLGNLTSSAVNLLGDIFNTLANTAGSIAKTAVAFAGA